MAGYYKPDKMIFEHFAINVTDIDSRIAWYVAHLDLQIVNAQREPPFMTFLADSGGRVIMELYHRSDAEITDFGTKHHLTFHMAFVSENAQADSERLVAKGASYVEEVKKDDGSHLVMLRDPWGMPLQLCQRTNRF